MLSTCYHGRVERAVDKIIVLACCAGGLALMPQGFRLPAALLFSVIAASLPELLPRRLVSLPALSFALLALASAPFAPFLPLAAYDLMRERRGGLRAFGTLVLLVALARLPLEAAAILLPSCALAALLCLRTRRAHSRQQAYRRRLDVLRGTSLALEEKNRGLSAAQDLEVRLATLAERGRIAREIHDNVGHLLTRSIMQTEALQVLRREDEKLLADLASLGDTLHEAMSTVRSSVHDLHEEAFDLEAQIKKAACAYPALSADIDYRASEVPLEVGYCFIAIVREALSNVVRHSKADQVDISLLAYPGFYRLLVHDNGPVAPPVGALGGFGGDALPSPSPGRGIGLVTMADRARAQGGVLRVGYERGFRVIVTIPKERQT